MSKKILVIDADKLYDRLECPESSADDSDGCACMMRISEVESILEECELDVIEFEAMVTPHIDANEIFGVRFHGKGLLLDNRFKVGERLQFFVVKPKKSEGK